MHIHPRTTRFMFGVAAILAAAALVLEFSSWIRGGTVNASATVNMVGVLVGTVTAAVNPTLRARLILIVVALALILPSAFLVLFR